MTPEEYNEQIKAAPPAQAVTLVLRFVDDTHEDWHFKTEREAKNFILSVQAAKNTGYGEEWLQDIFQINVRPFLGSIN